MCSLGAQWKTDVSVARPSLTQSDSQCRPETPAERAHLVFTSLGLRHLVVVSESSHVRGIITRRDLDAAAGHGAWRRNKMAPAPVQPPPSGARAVCNTFLAICLTDDMPIASLHQCRLWGLAVQPWRTRLCKCRQQVFDISLGCP